MYFNNICENKILAKISEVTVSRWLAQYWYTCFEQMLIQVFPAELQFNKANYFDTEVPFWNMELYITNGIVSSLTMNEMISSLK